MYSSQSTLVKMNNKQRFSNEPSELSFTRSEKHKAMKCSRKQARNNKQFLRSL